MSSLTDYEQRGHFLRDVGRDRSVGECDVPTNMCEIDRIDAGRGATSKLPGMRLRTFAVWGLAVALPAGYAPNSTFKRLPVWFGMGCCQGGLGVQRPRPAVRRPGLHIGSPNRQQLMNCLSTSSQLLCVMVPVAPALRPGVRGWLQTMVERVENHPTQRAHVWREAPITRAERTEAIRLGWNDAAWGRARRQTRRPTRAFLRHRLRWWSGFQAQCEKSEQMNALESVSHA